MVALSRHLRVIRIIATIELIRMDAWLTAIRYTKSHPHVLRCCAQVRRGNMDSKESATSLADERHRDLSIFRLLS
jgi:hypothetical protein